MSRIAQISKDAAYLLDARVSMSGMDLSPYYHTLTV
jgi:hypothetical protein